MNKFFFNYDVLHYSTFPGRTEVKIKNCIAYEMMCMFVKVKPILTYIKGFFLYL